jgi:hypothetical protein
MLRNLFRNLREIAIAPHAPQFVSQFSRKGKIKKGKLVSLSNMGERA